MTRIAPADLTPEWQELLEAARAARERAYAPYSGFRVGAAVRAANGQVYSGCNIENAVYGLTICAERAAIFCAVADGQRDLKALALVTDTLSTPCGSCRQVMVEFAPGLPVLISDTADHYWLTTAQALLPHSFTAEDLER